MRNYQNIERYLNELLADIYPQPPDPGHQAMIEDVCVKWLSILSGLNSILDVGCGQGQAIPVLKRFAPSVEGVTLGTDAAVCCAKGYPVNMSDMTFLPYRDERFILVFARHVLEHSPMPLITLMEWYRVAKQWLLLVLPDPQHYAYVGRNHYYVLNRQQAENILNVAGWRPIWRDDSEETEIRIFCEKVKR
jgi:ubiquinone/menaquinone biosynthesis C-methylase UbiE